MHGLAIGLATFGITLALGGLLLIGTLLLTVDEVLPLIIFGLGAAVVGLFVEFKWGGD